MVKIHMVCPQLHPLPTWTVTFLKLLSPLPQLSLPKARLRHVSQWNKVYGYHAILLPDMEARTKTITLTTTVTCTPVSETCSCTKGKLIQTTMAIRLSVHLRCWQGATIYREHCSNSWRCGWRNNTLSDLSLSPHCHILHLQQVLCYHRV